jgi:hypothetical protein
MDIELGRGFVELIRSVKQYYTCLQERGGVYCIISEPAGFEFVQVCRQAELVTVRRTFRRSPQFKDVLEIFVLA